MALRPALSAGLMSERGLLPIIQVLQASQPWWARQGEIGVVMLFGEDLDGSEVGSEAGSGELIGLFVVVAFGDHDEAMTLGEVGQG